MLIWHSHLVNKPITTLCLIFFLLQLIVLRSLLIFPCGPAGMTRHLYNLLYTNPLAIFCQINMNACSFLDPSTLPYHCYSHPHSQQGVDIPPLYCIPHAWILHVWNYCGYCRTWYMSYMILPWYCPLLHIVCYLCTAGTATCVGTAVTLYCKLCTAGTALMRGYCCHFILYAMHCGVLPHTWGSSAALYCMLCILCSVGDATGVGTTLCW